MTTTSEKLLALAAAHEEKARALRLAAAELNGHQTTTKQAQSNGLFDAAIKVRQAQRVAPGSDAHSAREQLVRAFLATGPKRSREVHAHLVEHGVTLTQDRIRQMMRGMSDVAQHGDTSSSRWQLKGRKNGSTPKKAKKAKAGKGAAHRYAYDAINERRKISAQLLDTFDTTTPRPFRMDAIPGLAPGSLGPLVRTGYLKKKGDGYIRTAKAYNPDYRSAPSRQARAAKHD